jgi:hypothetical protein
MRDRWSHAERGKHREQMNQYDHDANTLPAPCAVTSHGGIPEGRMGVFAIGSIQPPRVPLGNSKQGRPLCAIWAAQPWRSLPPGLPRIHVRRGLAIPRVRKRAEKHARSGSRAVHHEAIETSPFANSLCSS